MIVTLTVNPAVDQKLVLPKFVRGDTLRVKPSRFAAGCLGRYHEESLKGLGMTRGGTMHDAMRLGMATGTAAMLTPGTELCHRRELDILLPRVRVETIAEPVGSRN